MLKRWKMLAGAAVMAVSLLVPSVLAYAVEVSETRIEVPGGEKRHTVVAYGKSVAIVYIDGKTEIIANNPSGRVDVMIDGKVTKGVGIVVIPAQNGTNMVLEEGSFIVNGISDSQADTLKKMVVDGLTADKLVVSAAEIESGEGLQGTKAFTIGARGDLLASDGSKAPASALPEMQVKTPEVVYQAFAEEMEENIRIEQEAAQKAREEEAAGGQNEERVDEEERTGEEESSNGVTGMCLHEWEPEDMDILFIGQGYEKCATPPFYRCTKCGIVRFEAANVHVHGEDFCEYCGYNVRGERAGSCSEGEHVYEDITLPTSERGSIIEASFKWCHTGLIHVCTKCGIINVTDADMHEHGEDYCEYCGFDQYGSTAAGTPQG